MLEGPGLPYAVEHLWGIFIDLHTTRTATGFGGLNPITYLDIDAYQRVTGVVLSPEEVALIRMADGVAMDQVRMNNDTGEKAPPPSEQSRVVE